MTSVDSCPDLSVLVASFNTKDLLLACLKSLETATDGLAIETFVVDNASSDGTPEAVASAFPGVRLIANATNEGFSKANNRALRESKGRYVLLLNPDTLIPPDTLGPMARFLDENPPRRYGRVSRRSSRRPSRRSLQTHVPDARQRFRALHRASTASFRRRSGATAAWRTIRRGVSKSIRSSARFMMVRREAVEDVGGLDEEFFMFGEDLDWAYRMKAKDWAVWYVGDRRVIHHKGASVRKEPHRMNWHFHRSMILFHKKHLVDRYPFFVNWLVYAGVSVRYAFKSAVLAAQPKPPEAMLGPRDAARLRTRHGISVDVPRENEAGA
jgi:GT2 family glycosyltransferase